MRPAFHHPATNYPSLYSGINVCGVTAGSAKRKVLCWGETRDIAFVPEDLEPAGMVELGGGGGEGGRGGEL